MSWLYQNCRNRCSFIPHIKHVFKPVMSSPWKLRNISPFTFFAKFSPLLRKKQACSFRFSASFFLLLFANKLVRIIPSAGPRRSYDCFICFPRCGVGRPHRTQFPSWSSSSARKYIPFPGIIFLSFSSAKNRNFGRNYAAGEDVAIPVNIKAFAAETRAARLLFKERS